MKGSSYAFSKSVSQGMNSSRLLGGVLGQGKEKLSGGKGGKLVISFIEGARGEKS